MEKYITPSKNIPALIQVLDMIQISFSTSVSRFRVPKIELGTYLQQIDITSWAA